MPSTPSPRSSPRASAATLRTVERDATVRAVVVTGAGRAFSAGQDVRELAAETAERGPRAVGDQLRLRFNPIVLRLRGLEKPVIAAINGVATGAGLGVALAADVRVAAASASFVLAPVGIGLIPGVGATALLPAVIGLGRATELCFTGERIDAGRALAIGLVYRGGRPTTTCFRARPRSPPASPSCRRARSA